MEPNLVVSLTSCKHSHIMLACRCYGRVTKPQRRKSSKTLGTESLQRFLQPGSIIFSHSPSSSCLTSSDLCRTNIGPNNLASKERAPTSCQQNILSKKYCWRKLWAIQISWEVREKCFHPKQSGNKWKWKLEVSWTHIPLWPLLRTLRPVSLRYPLFQRLKNPRFEGGRSR